MRVLFIYRHPDMGISIGKVFRPIEEKMREYCSVDSFYLPSVGYGLRSLWRNIQCVKHKLRSDNYDVIHITGTENYLLPFLKKYKTVLTVHDIASFENNCSGLRLLFKRKLFIDTIKLASSVTFISDRSMRETEERITLDRTKCSIIYNPVDSICKFKAKPFNSIKPIILHIGTQENKNLVRTIWAIKDIVCHVRIVGKLSDEQKYELKSNKVDYTNVWNIDEHEMLLEYEKSDIVNFPSTYEGFGMPIIEGQAVGRIVLTSDIEPTNKVGGDGVYLVDPYSVESIRDGYHAIISNANLREKLIEQGVDNVGKYDLGNITREYFEVYKEIINR